MRIAIGQASTAAAALLAAVLALPEATSAQSLGEAAERAKKERKGKPTKVITESELRSAGGGAPQMPVSSSDTTEPAATGEATSAAGGEATSSAPDGGEATRSEGGGQRAKTEDELRAEAEANWRQRRQKAQDDVSRLGSEANRLQTALNDITQSLYGNNRTTMMTQLDEVKKQLAVAQQSVTDLEEEGRRARYRP
jgi:hypothetical protein